MKTAQEMFDFAIKNGYGHDSGIITGGIQHFFVLKTQLSANENVKFSFLAYYHPKNVMRRVSDAGDAAFGFTNDKIIIGRKKGIGEISQQIQLNNLNDVRKKVGMLMLDIEFDTLKESFIARFTDRDEIHKTFAALNEFLQSVRNGNQTTAGTQISTADELRKFKQLLDDGIISQDDFDAKKKQLLGL